MLLSLPTRPEVSIDCSIAYGEVTRVPWLRSELERSLQQHVATFCPPGTPFTLSTAFPRKKAP